MLEVKQVSVLAPSTKERPRANEISKSFTSKDLFSKLTLLL